MRRIAAFEVAFVHRTAASRQWHPQESYATFGVGGDGDVDLDGDVDVDDLMIVLAAFGS